MDFIQHLFKFLTGLDPKEEEPPKPVTYFMPPKTPVSPSPAPAPEPAPAPRPTPPPAPVTEEDLARERLREALSEFPFEDYAAERNADFAEHLREYITDEDVVTRIMAARTPCIPLDTKKADEDSIPIGASRMGGTTADLPRSVDYPTLCGYRERIRAPWLRDENGNHIDERIEEYEESAMQLMLQLDLSDIPESDGLLPSRGMLWIFWSGEIMDLLHHKQWAEKEGGEVTFFGSNTDLFKVLYDPGIEPLERKPQPCQPYRKSFDKPLESYRVMPVMLCYDLDPNVFDLSDYDLDSNDAVNIYGEKLFGIPTFCCNAELPRSDEENLYQSSFHLGCLEGLWWYQQKGAFLSHITMESDVD